MANDDISQEAVGRRLRAIRQALEIPTQREMAARIGAETNQYNNWENGVGKIPTNYAVKVHAISGFTLDYLFRGDESSLPLRLVTLLEASRRPQTESKHAG